MKGFLSTAWHELASTHFSYPEDSPSYRDDGSHCIAKAIRALHKLTHSIWLGRNDALHRQHETALQRQRTAMDAEIARHHADSTALPAADQHYCEIRLESLLRRSSAYKRRWLYRIRRARTLFQQIGEKNQTRIPQFFRRPRNTPNIAHQPTVTDETSHNIRNPPAQSNLHPLDTCTSHKRPIRTTQSLITDYIHERASNTNNPCKPLSPPPT